MRFINGDILTEDFEFKRGAFSVCQGRLWDFSFGESQIKERDVQSQGSGLYPPQKGQEEEIVDLKGLKVIPGLIDIHIHGCNGVDFSTGSEGSIVDMCKYLGRSGITSFAGTLMTMAMEDIETCCEKANGFVRKRQSLGGAKLSALYLEGPYFSEGKRGAQPLEYLDTLSIYQLERLIKISGGLLKLVAVAPEMKGALAFIKEASCMCRVSMGHTEANYETARGAIENGATQITHLFNGMNSIHHRHPGIQCAGADSQTLMAELICDGVHIHPSVVRAAFKLFDHERIILISDALSPCGKEAGEFQMGRNKIYLKNGVARLEDGTLAGSLTNLYQCMIKTIEYGMKPEIAIKAATWNPAVSLGLQDSIGSLSLGKSADFIVCDEAFHIHQVYINGRRVPEKQDL